MKRLAAVAAVAACLAAGAATHAPAAVAQAVPTSQLPCPAWSMYGATLGRTFSNDCDSPIDPSTVATLVPAWVLDTARPVTATPVVADGVLYVGSWEAVMYALDADTGSVLWRHQSPPAPGATYGPIVSSAAVADVPFDAGVRRLVIFGSGPRLYALDASDGSEVWVHDASAGVVGSPTEYESSPLVYGDLVLVGRDTHNEGIEETGGVRGGLVALDVRTGAVRWTFEPEQERTGMGCGGMWGSPVLDPERGLAYMGTANCPHEEFGAWTPYVNAVTAVRIADGTPVWSFQPSGPPDDDTDFGATPNLFVDSNGRQVLGAGKKDGTYYALDPGTGALLWSTHVVDPAPNVGGFIGSPAVYEGNVFGGTAIGTPPFFHSFDGATGAVRFQGGVGPTYGATAVANGVAFNSALDDTLKAYDTETGQLLWAAPLLGPGSSSAAIYEDMVFIGSGTSTSDACAKDNPTDDACVFVFDVALATLGGIQAFRLAGGGQSAAPPSGGEPSAPSGVAPAPAPATAPESSVRSGDSALARTGGSTPLLAAFLLVLGLGVRRAAGRR